jgi:hypothetical protein
MEVNIIEILLMIKLKEKENLNGMKIKFMKGIGKIIV